MYVLSDSLDLDIPKRGICNSLKKDINKSIKYKNRLKRLRK